MDIFTIARSVVGIALAVAWFLSRRRVRELQRQLSEQDSAYREQIDHLNSELSESQKLVAEQSGSIYGLREQLESSKAQIKNQDDLAVLIDQKLPGITAQALQRSQESLLEQANKEFGATVTPISAALKSSEELLRRIEKERTQHYGSIAEQLSTVNSSCAAFLSEASQVKSALVGSSNYRGNWGEFVLRRVLEQGGLAKHFTFVEQDRVKDQDDKTFIPDCKITLPGGGTLIVDSKVSLKAYVDYADATTESDRKSALENLVASIKSHVRDLAKKDYANLYSQSIDSVIMFVPGEHFISAAVEIDPEICEFGRRNKIIIATPNTMFFIVKCAELMWSEQKLNDEARAIGEVAKVFYDRLFKIQEHINNEGAGLRKAVKFHNELVGSFDRNFVRDTARFKELGIQVTRELPDSKSIDLTVRESTKHLTPSQEEELVSS